MAIAARSNERVSAAATAIRWTNSGVSSRASKPRASRRGKKAPAAFGAMSDRFVNGQGAVDRSDLASLAGGVTAGATLGAFGRGRGAGGEIAHVLGLDLPAELLAQFVGSRLDDRVMMDPDDGALDAIERHRNFRGLAQELVEFSLEIGRRPIHGLPPFMPRSVPP